MVNLITNLLAVRPNGLWEKVVFKINGVFANFIITIIFLSIILKILMLPLDYLNRKSSLKMTEMQNKIQPKVNEIQRRYKDKQMQNQKLNELYRKEGFNPMGSCLSMLAVLVLSSTIFISLFSSLGNIAQYNIVNQYEQLQVAYVQEYVEDNNLQNYNIDEVVITISQSNDENIIATANQNVANKYKEINQSFLWIKNIWLADAPNEKAIPTFEKYCSLGKVTFENQEQQTNAQNVYNAVLGELTKSQGSNGYFILAILAAVSTFLAQYFLTKSQKKNQKSNYKNQNGQNAQMPGSGGGMLIIMPIIMLIFTLNYTSAFAVYIVISQLISMASTPLINKLIKIKSK